ncbi:ABC transporter substrate-binding protein [Paracoccus onubensis]|uniref:ABC transporter substrate-binding protein n=1 Tax=Paracoccus onubensis TaxID=1675788 RepID=UPI0027319103|nr:ABC transporter substrate-binding protein [Paracoccus onubensis]MDP0929683.1 ABC transporter substrate-binding protein [Paracoccus onubensis]
MQSKLLLVGCLASVLAVPSYADTIRAALNQDLRSSQPGVNRDGNSDTVMAHVAEGLVSYDRGGNVQPLLAETYAVSEDGLTYTFKLREGVKFHNGETMTSADVKWSFDYYLDPETNWYCLEEVDGTNGLKIVSYDTPDDQTFTITIDKPDAMFIDTLARTDCGGTAILHETSLNPDGTWNKPIGTGPFMFGEWKRGQSVQFDKFDDYQSRSDESDGFVGKKDPMVDSIVFMAIPDAATVKIALESGDLDVATIQESDVEEIRANPGLEVGLAWTPVRNTFILQTRDPVLQDVRIRQALAISLNYEELVASVTEGLGKVNNSPVYDTSNFYTEVQQQGFEYNPDKARELLAEAGYNGEEIVVMCNKRAAVPSFNMSVLAQQMWQAVGLNVRLEVLDWPTQLDKYRSGDHMMQATTYSSRFDVASGFEQISGNKDDQPRKVWENPDALELIDQALATLDPAKRQPLFDELHKMILHDVPIIITHNDVSPIAYSTEIKGMDPWTSPMVLWNLSRGE